MMKQQATGADAFAPFQKALSEGWTKALESFQQSATQGGPAFNVGGSPLWQLPQMPQAAKLPELPKFSIAPEKLQAIQQQYVADATELWRSGFNAKPEGDKRFADEAWGSNPLAAFSAAVYLLNGRTMLSMAESIDADEKTKARMRFAVEQWMAASAPSNSLAFNAKRRKSHRDQGESIAKGIQNLLHDVQQGHLHDRRERCSRWASNVATTEGAVVFENELFQLLEYKPLTKGRRAKVYERPFLLVPPCINKFYILDLQPENSLIRYAVEQGHRTFVVSWRNPDESMATRPGTTTSKTPPSRRSTRCRKSAASKQINTLGFCVGGTILSTALAVLAARGEKPAASATLLTTFLDFSDTGILDIFVDEAWSAYRELQLGKGGLLPGGDLASTFSFLRPNDLVWNYVVGNYLKGETPPPFDLLYWNSDATNLPGPFYAWYLRNTYHENKLAKPGKRSRCAARRSTWGRHSGLHLRLARRPHRAHRRRLCVHATAAGQEALRDGRVGPHRRRDQPAGQEKAQPLDPRRRQVSQDPGRMAGRRAGAPRQLVDRLGTMAQGPRGQAGRRAQGLRQRQGLQGHRAGARPLRQGQSLTS
jgi:polyhydroxyalkanoate synthase